MVEAIGRGLLHQQLPGNQFIQAIYRLQLPAPGGQAHQVHAECQAQDGARFQDLPRARAELPQTRLDDGLANGVGQREVFQCVQAAGQPARLQQGLEEFEQEERVAARDRLEAGREGDLTPYSLRPLASEDRGEEVGRSGVRDRRSW